MPRSAAPVRTDTRQENRGPTGTAGIDIARPAESIRLALIPDRVATNVDERSMIGNASSLATSTSQHGYKDVPSPLPPEPGALLSDGSGLVALQEWEGYVIEIGQDDFVARLLDITAAAKREKEEATIPLAELSDEDRAKIRLGSIFRWVIGYHRTVTGTKSRVSRIVFRNLPVLTQAEWDEALEWAAELRKSFGL